MIRWATVTDVTAEGVWVVSAWLTGRTGPIPVSGSPAVGDPVLIVRTDEGELAAVRGGDTRYLPLTGGTVTGPLTVGELKVSTTGSFVLVAAAGHNVRLSAGHTHLTIGYSSSTGPGWISTSRPTVASHPPESLVTKGYVDAIWSKRSLPRVAWKSGSIAPWNYGEFADLPEILAEVQALGLNTVNIPVPVAAVDIYDSEPAVDPDRLAWALEIAAELPANIRIIAEPYPWIDNGNQSETLWDPTDVPLWFTSWTAACVEVAEAFPQAAMVYIGSNMVTLEGGNDAEWIAAADAVRAVTSAQVSYRCNWWYEDARLDALCAWSFLRHLDVVSVAAYFELTDTASPDADEVRACLDSSMIYDRRQDVVADVARLHEVTGKPIFFGELVTSRWLGSLAAPWNPDPFPAARWNDLRVALSAGKASTSPPTFETLRNGVQSYGFSATQTEQLFFEVQIPRGWNLGTTIKPHIHWSPGNSTNTGSVVWQLEYSWANVGDPFPATTTLTATQAATGVPYAHQIASFGDVDGTGKRESSVFVCRLARVGGDAADTFPTDALGISVDFHYQAVALGSPDDMGTPSKIHDPMVQARMYRAYVDAFAGFDWWLGFSVYGIAGFGDSGYRLSIPAIDYLKGLPT